MTDTRLTCFTISQQLTIPLGQTFELSQVSMLANDNFVMVFVFSKYCLEVSINWIFPKKIPANAIGIMTHPFHAYLKWMS